MELKKTHIYPHELIFEQTNNIIKLYITDYNNNNNCYKISFNLNKYGTKNIIGCKNLILIFDINSDDIIDNNQIKSLIDTIKLLSNGHEIESFSNNYEIFMMLQYYGLEIKQIGSKIYFPLPFSLFQNGFIPCYLEKFNIHFKTNNPNLINYKITTNIEIFYGELNFNQKYLIDYKINYWDKIINSLNDSTYINNKNLISEIVKLDNLIYFGYENSQLHEMCTTFSKKNIWFNIPAISDKVTDLFLCLVNNQTNEIIKEKFFNKVGFKKSGVYEYYVSYEELVYDLMMSNKKLSEGFYRIPFENIYSNGAIIKSSDEYSILIDLDENIDISNYKVKIYGLFNYKINIITDEKKNNYCTFRTYYDSLKIINLYAIQKN